MNLQCAWCKRLIGTVVLTDGQPLPVSHGICPDCPDCLERELADLAALLPGVAESQQPTDERVRP